MKVIHTPSASTEQRSKHLSVKTDNKSDTVFKKSDFLTPGDVATKCGVNIEKAKDALKKLHFKRSIFIINGHKQPIVMRLGTNRLFVHPMAISEVKKYLDNQKG